jgi:hypothetical protein
MSMSSLNFEVYFLYIHVTKDYCPAVYFVTRYYKKLFFKKERRKQEKKYIINSPWYRVFFVQLQFSCSRNFYYYELKVHHHDHKHQPMDPTISKQCSILLFKVYFSKILFPLHGTCFTHLIFNLSSQMRSFLVYNLFAFPT